MLVAVVIIFMLCWGPLLILNVLTAFEIVKPLQPGPVKYIKTIFHLMAYFNRFVLHEEKAAYNTGFRYYTERFIVKR